MSCWDRIAPDRRQFNKAQTTKTSGVTAFKWRDEGCMIEQEDSSDVDLDEEIVRSFVHHFMSSFYLVIAATLPWWYLVWVDKFATACNSCIVKEWMQVPAVKMFNERGQKIILDSERSTNWTHPRLKLQFFASIPKVGSVIEAKFFSDTNISGCKKGNPIIS